MPNLYEGRPGGPPTKIAMAIARTEPPPVYTLHAYALRQLMAARVNVGSGSGHARVADDWEERHIVEEDLKVLLGETRVKSVRDRIARLAAAWEANPAVPPRAACPSAPQSRPDRSEESGGTYPGSTEPGRLTD